jgi:hypothetical protein
MLIFLKLWRFGSFEGMDAVSSSVGSKEFLITIGDRSVKGLTARDQMVGPWQVPVADVGVTCASYAGVPDLVGLPHPFKVCCILPKKIAYRQPAAFCDLRGFRDSVLLGLRLT